MIKALGILAAAGFIAASLVGTVTSGWFLGEALSPLRGGPIAGPLSLGMVLVLLACAAEGLRLGLSLMAERIWRHSPFQAIAVACPLWLACTGYCTLMPLLALALLPLFPVGSDVLTIAAPAWVLVQAAAGLLPAIAWPQAVPRSQVARDVGKERLPAAIEAAPRLALASPPPASADELFQVLSGLSGLPAGSALSRRARIGDNREIVISLTGLAALVGRPRSTVARWLEELEQGERIARRRLAKEACIVLQPSPSRLNGGTHTPIDMLQAENRAA